jgi:hypothetical protein
MKKKLRSGLEAKVLSPLKESAYMYEEIKLQYIKKPSIYTPDLLLNNGIFIEVKGYFDAEDRAKHLLIKEQYPDLDIRFVFQSANKKIHKSSKTTYADWCDKYGFLYAEREVPQAWLRERGSATGRQIFKDRKSSGRKTATKYTSGCVNASNHGE